MTRVLRDGSPAAVPRTGGQHGGVPVWSMQPPTPEPPPPAESPRPEGPLAGYSERVLSATVNGVHLLDVTEANVHHLRLAGDVTLRLRTPPRQAEADDLRAWTLTVIWEQMPPGAFQVTWGVPVLWDGGVLPDATPVSGGFGVATLLWLDPVATWFGFVRGLDRGPL